MSNKDFDIILSPARLVKGDQRGMSEVTIRLYQTSHHGILLEDESIPGLFFLKRGTEGKEVTLMFDQAESFTTEVAARTFLAQNGLKESEKSMWTPFFAQPQNGKKRGVREINWGEMTF